MFYVNWTKPLAGANLWKDTNTLPKIAASVRWPISSAGAAKL